MDAVCSRLKKKRTIQTVTRNKSKSQGGVSALVKGNLHLKVFVLNSETSREISEQRTLPSRRHLFQRWTWAFQHGKRAKPHTGHVTKAWLTKKSVQMPDWPAHRPDLSPIENVQCTFNSKTGQQRPHTVVQFPVGKCFIVPTGFEICCNNQNWNVFILKSQHNPGGKTSNSVLFSMEYRSKIIYKSNLGSYNPRIQTRTRTWPSSRNLANSLYRSRPSGWSISMAGSFHPTRTVNTEAHTVKISCLIRQHLRGRSDTGGESETVRCASSYRRCSVVDTSRYRWGCSTMGQGFVPLHWSDSTGAGALGSNQPALHTLLKVTYIMEALVCSTVYCTTVSTRLYYSAQYLRIRIIKFAQVHLHEVN